MLLFALVSVGCGVTLRSPVASAPVAVETPSSAALAARELVFAATTRRPAIEAAVKAGTLSQAQAFAEASAIRDVLIEVERLNVDLSLWSKATHEDKRAEAKAAVLERLKRMGWLLSGSRADWQNLVDAYVRIVATVGGAQ